MQTFIKKGSPESLQAEREGLTALNVAIQQSGSLLKIPPLIECHTHHLTLAAITVSAPTPLQWQHAGQGLAELHSLHQPAYGWHQNNFIGLGKQANILSQEWPRFYTEYRLAFKIRSIEDTRLRKKYLNILSDKQTTLIKLLDTCNAPSLVHGDLWHGNILFDTESVWLIDPAIYWGDSEVDIAMTEMFGGFSPQFYAAYNRVRPLSEHYALKKVVYNLYHYLNHYLLFGDSYQPECDRGFDAIQQL